MDDSIYLRAADIVATKSNDPSTKVGAILVSDDNLVGEGHNQFPRGVEETDERWSNRNLKYPIVVHAEINAIIQAGGAQSCTLYVTHPPCSTCAGIIIQAGVKRVVFRTPSAEFLARWDSLGLEMLTEAGVEFSAQ